jgi:acetyl-CoA synthetase
MADIGWITGHSYIVYGPLSLGATSVLYEGVPQFPDAGRPWRIAERLDVNIFHTSPTAIRMLRKAGGDEPKKYNYHFKHMTTVGEPIEPDVWRWYHEVVGKGQAVIVDTWWQTETGGFLITTKPALDAMKPGSAGPAALGIYPIIWDEIGKEVKAGSGTAGNICIRNPWPGIMQTIWGSDDRFITQYYKKYCKDPDSKDWRDWPYYAADGAVLHPTATTASRPRRRRRVAGHRLEPRSGIRLLGIPEIASAVVPGGHKGRVGRLHLLLSPGLQKSRQVTSTIETMIGKIAAPKPSTSSPTCPKRAARLCAAFWPPSQSHGHRRHHDASQPDIVKPANSPRPPTPASARRPDRLQAVRRRNPGPLRVRHGSAVGINPCYRRNHAMIHEDIGQIVNRSPSRW